MQRRDVAAGDEMAAGPDLTEQRKLIEFAAKAAETFVSAYYSASDSPHRVQVSGHHAGVQAAVTK